MQIEIINPSGQVSYRRPHSHPDVQEALRRPGYSVRLELPPGTEGYDLGWEILNIFHPCQHLIEFNSVTRRFVVWSVEYIPSPSEEAMAKAWVADLGPQQPEQLFRDISSAFANAPVDEPAAPLADPEAAIRAGCANDELMEECVAFLRVGYDAGDALPEIMRRICANFALRALGIAVQGQPPLRAPEPRVEPDPDPVAFPVAGKYAWLLPEMRLVRIIQQHDAFEWEACHAGVWSKFVAGNPSPINSFIVPTIQLVPISEEEYQDIELRVVTSITKGETPVIPEHPRCRAERDGTCTWRHCPQPVDGYPEGQAIACPYIATPANGKEGE